MGGIRRWQGASLVILGMARPCAACACPGDAERRRRRRRGSRPSSSPPIDATENIQDVPVSVATLAPDHVQSIFDARRRHHRLGRARARPVRRELQRPRRAAILHSRARQHRFRPRRLAAGLGGDGRGRDGERHAQELPDLRRRPDRGAARPAGHPVRPQHARGHRQDRHGPADQRVRRARLASAIGSSQHDRRSMPASADRSRRTGSPAASR